MPSSFTISSWFSTSAPRLPTHSAQYCRAAMSLSSFCMNRMRARSTPSSTIAMRFSGVDEMLPRHSALNRWASASVVRSSSWSSDRTAPFCTILTCTSGCVDISARPNATSLCSRGRRTRRPRAMSASRTFAMATYQRLVFRTLGHPHRTATRGWRCLSVPQWL